MVYLSVLGEAHAAQLSDLPRKVSICADAGRLSSVVRSEPVDFALCPATTV